MTRAGAPGPKARVPPPPLDHRAYVRPKRGARLRTVPAGRVPRTVPGSRVGSSKLSRLEVFRKVKILVFHYM